MHPVSPSNVFGTESFLVGKEAKIFLPLVILWKTLKAGVSSAFVSAKQLVKNFYKLFYNILFWNKAFYSNSF